MSDLEVGHMVAVWKSQGESGCLQGGARASVMVGLALRTREGDVAMRVGLGVPRAHEGGFMSC